MNRLSLCLLLVFTLMVGYFLGGLCGERFVQQEAIARGLADPDVYGSFSWRFSRLDEQPRNGTTPLTICDFLREDKKHYYANWRQCKSANER